MLIVVFKKIVCIIVFMRTATSIKSGVFGICNILKGDKQKSVLGILKFVSMLFKYLKKGMTKKVVPGILRFVSILFRYLKKGMSKKIVLDVLRFVSMLFNVIIF